MDDHNHLSEIRHIREEIVTNKQEKDCDYVFKVITIGDAGKSLFNLLEKNLKCIQHNNFLVLKSDFTYIIFKTNKQGENHINITKIPSVDQIPKAIELIQNLTDCFVITQTIDNIIATTNLKRKLSLVNISLAKKFPKIKYNN